MERQSISLLQKPRQTLFPLGLILILLWPIGLRAEDQSFAIISAGVSSTEDAPFVSSEYRFLPGDAVYVTFQISGAKVKTNETTDVREIAVEYTANMQDQAKVPMAEPMAGEIKEQLSPEDKHWIPKRRATFIVPTLVAAGQYRIHVTAKDLLGAVEAATDIPFRIAGERVQATDSIEVTNFRFLRQEDSRDALAVPAYRPGDTVFTAFDIVGFAKATGNKYDVSYGIAVHGPDGKPFFSQNENAEVTDASFYPAHFLPERADVLTKPSSLRGEYTVTLTVQDLLSHKTQTSKQIFTLE